MRARRVPHRHPFGSDRVSAPVGRGRAARPAHPCQPRRTRPRGLPRESAPRAETVRQATHALPPHGPARRGRDPRVESCGRAIHTLDKVTRPRDKSRVSVRTWRTQAMALPDRREAMPDAVNGEVLMTAPRSLFRRGRSTSRIAGPVANQGLSRRLGSLHQGLDQCQQSRHVRSKECDFGLERFDLVSACQGQPPCGQSGTGRG